MPTKPIFHYERFTTVEGANVRVQATLQIFGVYAVCPTIADLGLEGSPSEVEPRLVEVGAALIGAGNPGEQRQSICHQPEQPVGISVRSSAGAQRPPLLMSRERCAKIPDVTALCSAHTFGS